MSDCHLRFRKLNVVGMKLKIKSESEKHHFEWHYSTPKASWTGGRWESIVKLVKHTLFKVTHNALLTYTELLTVCKEAEATANDRPLTAAYTSADELEVITPAKLLIGKPLRPWPDFFSGNDLPLTTELRERWKQRNAVTGQWWRVFRKNYLTELQQRNKWFDKKPNLQVGDIVAVEIDNIKRTHWPLARVEELMPDREGNVRSVKIAVNLPPNKRGKDPTVVTRSIRQLYPLPLTRKE